MSGRFNKFPYAMVFPKITNITVKNDVLIGSSFKVEKMYERNGRLTSELFREMNQRYTKQDIPKSSKTYEKFYRKNI
jgi:hypothetical protein